MTKHFHHLSSTPGLQTLENQSCTLLGFALINLGKGQHIQGDVAKDKHHDGFCLWPSMYTEHSIKHSPYRNGHGDIVREISDACRRHGIAFGVYLSPWDRHHADYGKPAYIEYFRNQLREILTNYGDIFEIWFDGANGGDGFYGGAREQRHIDPVAYYDWPVTWQIVRTLQPSTVIWGSTGSDIRWVGNERGFAGDPCWATMDRGPYSIEKNLSGVRNGSVWRPAEVDVSIRPGWFWHEWEDDEVKDCEQLLKIYLESVGRGASLLLNLAPDRRGQIPPHDVDVLTAWGNFLQTCFGTNLAHGACALASNVRGGDSRFSAANVINANRTHYWTTDDNVRSAELVLELGEPKRIDLLRLREFLPLGQRVVEFSIDIWNQQWVEVARGVSIGSQRLVRLDTPVTAEKIRLNIINADACPAISEFALFLLPVIVKAPTISRDRTGMVEIHSTAKQAVFYSIDGSAPSLPYQRPFPLTEGGVVRAFAVQDQHSSAEAFRRFDIAKNGWRILSASALKAENLIDENAHTLWIAALITTARNNQHPQRAHWIDIDLGRFVYLTGFTLQPAVHLPNGTGAPTDYQCLLSTDAMNWRAAATGEFHNIAESSILQRVHFKRAHRARYLRLVITRSSANWPLIAFAELGVLTQLPKPKRATNFNNLQRDAV